MSESDRTGGIPPVRGLATVALLKVNFDAGRDHLGMFEPFVLDAVGSIADESVQLEDVAHAVVDRHGLSIPHNTLRTLLGRITRKGYLRREGGRWFRTDKVVTADLVARRLEVEARQDALADAFCAFAVDQGAPVGSRSDGLALILAFLEKFHVGLALRDDSLEPAIGVDPSEVERISPELRVVAAFLKLAAEADSQLEPVVQEILEGFVLQNTLLLRDLSTATRNFQDLRVYFDSGLLFAALGFEGPAAATPVLELLALLLETGASLNVFEPTIAEMRRVLAVYESRLATAAGRRELRDTPMSRFMIASRWSPSDVRSRSGLIEHELRKLGFTLRQTPVRQPQWTLDERRLATMLAQRDDITEPRVVHDVDCAAGILTLRRGRTSASFDDVGAVMVSRSTKTVATICTWYSGEGLGGVPPIVRYLQLSNIAWLKRPASASRLKMHELVALCSAALRPSRRTWLRFQEHLQRLVESGELSSDEAVAVVASSLADSSLADLDADGDDPDAASLNEVIDRVKATYRDDADSRINEAEARADATQLDALRLELGVRNRAHAIANLISWCVAILLGVSFTVGTALTVVSLRSREAPPIAAVFLALAPLAIGGLITLIWGGSLREFRSSLSRGLTSLVMRAFLREPRIADMPPTDSDHASSPPE